MKQQQFAALPYRISDQGKIEVLIATSRDTRQWIMPKGRPEKKMKPRAVAKMEARQECGVVGIVEKYSGAFFYTKRETDDKIFLCRIKVFLLRVQKQLEDWKEKDQRQIAWVTISEAAARLAANTNITDKKSLRAVFTNAQVKILATQKQNRRPKKPANALRKRADLSVSASV